MSISSGARVAPERVKAHARALGFDAVGVADAHRAWPAGARLEEFLRQGRHGDMEWMAQHRRAHPTALWPEAAAIGAFVLVAGALAMLRYRQTIE